LEVAAIGQGPRQQLGAVFGPSRPDDYSLRNKCASLVHHQKWLLKYLSRDRLLPLARRAARENARPHKRIAGADPEIDWRP
jgi:hypothetical protein